MKFIKYQTMLFISVFISILFCVNVLAENEGENEKIDMSAEMITVVNHQLSNEDIGALKEAEIYGLVPDEQLIFRVPVLKVFDELFSSTIGEPLEIRLATAKANNKSKQNYTDYVVFDNLPYVVTEFRHNSDTMVIADRERYALTVPTYITDIMSLPEGLAEKENCVIEGIYCFDASSSYFGTAVYLKTDKGVYVRYYEEPTSEAVLFTEDEFRTKGALYYDYITSYEYNYNEKGEALGGTTTDFLSFIQKTTDPNAEISSDTTKPTLQTICFTAAAVVIIIIFAGGGAVFLTRKHKG